MYRTIFFDTGGVKVNLKIYRMFRIVFYAYCIEKVDIKYELFMREVQLESIIQSLVNTCTWLCVFLFFFATKGNFAASD